MSAAAKTCSLDFILPGICQRGGRWGEDEGSVGVVCASNRASKRWTCVCVLHPVLYKFDSRGPSFILSCFQKEIKITAKPMASLTSVCYWGHKMRKGLDRLTKDFYDQTVFLTR